MWAWVEIFFYLLPFAIVALIILACLHQSWYEKRALKNKNAPFGNIDAICTKGIEHFQNDRKVQLELLSDKITISQVHNGESSSVSLSYDKILDIRFDKRELLKNATFAVKIKEVVDVYIKYNSSNDTEEYLIFKDLNGGVKTFEKLFMKRAFSESQNVPPPPHPPYVEL